ncbi:MAG: Clp protease N-terminal domain-containing protein, partial [Limisphaerales bacterium]
TYITLSVRGRRKNRQFQKGLSNLSRTGKQTLQLACEETPRLHHNFVGTEHVLLGLTRLETGTVANVMKRLGLNRDLIQRELEQFVGGFPAQQPIVNIPYTPRVRKAILLATKEAKILNHDRISGEDIFLGLLLEGDGVAARVLNKLSVKIDETRAAILKESASHGHQT